MSSLFKAQWPQFAVFEAILILPGGFLALFANPAIQGLLQSDGLQSIPLLEQSLGLSGRTVFLLSLAIAAVAIWFAALGAIDGLLQVKRGVAILSGLAILFWTLWGFAVSDLLPFEPAGGALGVAGTAACLAFLVHLWPLATGFTSRAPAGGSSASEANFPSAAGQSPHPTWLMAKLPASARTPPSQAGRHGWIGPAALGSVFAGLAVGLVLMLTAPGVRFARLDATPVEIRAPAEPVMIPAAAPPETEIVEQPPARAEPAESTASAEPGTPSDEAAAEDPPASVPVQAQIAPLPIIVTPPRRDGDEGASAIRQRDGHFYFKAEVNGTAIPMVFDTGASSVSLRAEDAEQAGIRVSPRDFTGIARTANGISKVAPIEIRTMSVGDITLHDVRGTVNEPGTLSISLLGQSFTNRLAGIAIKENRLVLQAR